jgi:hypothetical protein
MLDLGARAVKQMVSYNGAPGSPADPHELVSCGEADGELQRGARVPRRDVGVFHSAFSLTGDFTIQTPRTRLIIAHHLVHPRASSWGSKRIVGARR